MPPAWAFPAAAGAAAVITSIELGFKHGRHPFGEPRACGWWALIVLGDAIVAGVAVAGGLVVGGSASLRDFGVIGWLAIGVLAPLGLRSPVRTTQVGGKEEAVGLTEYYDRYRIRCDRHLDDQITVLRRRDRSKAIRKLAGAGWTSWTLAAAIRGHLGDLRSRDQADAALIEQKIESALTFPDEQRRFDGLVQVVADEGFGGLHRELQRREPLPAETRAAKALSEPSSAKPKRTRKPKAKARAAPSASAKRKKKAPAKGKKRSS